jgi:hypothetical protein
VASSLLTRYLEAMAMPSPNEVTWSMR